MIQGNLDISMQDCVSLDYYKEAQTLDCSYNHHLSLESAIGLFGRLKDDKTCERPGGCPLCRKRVTRYQPDTQFQNLVDEILASRQPRAALMIPLESSSLPKSPEKSNPSTAQLQRLPSAALPSQPIQSEESQLLHTQQIFKRARMLSNHNKPEDALTLLRRIERFTTPEVIFALGCMSSRTGRYADAKSYFEKTLTLNSNHFSAMAYVNLAYMSFNGRGVAVNRELANNFLQRAAALGYILQPSETRGESKPGF